MPQSPGECEAVIRKDATDWKISAVRFHNLDTEAMAKEVENAAERMTTCEELVKVLMLRRSIGLDSSK